jgi:hypothetical protein
MARIRTVKPDFFTHPSITPLSIPARLLLLSLLTQADDEGRLYDQGAKIRGLAFGDDDRVNIAALLAELADHGRILRYEIGGRDCIEITGFHDHQRVNRPTPSTIPAPGLFSAPSPNGQGVLTESSPPEGKGRERKGREGKGIAGEVSPRPRDEVFEALCEVGGHGWDGLNTVERGRLNKARGLARESGATPEMIRQAAERWPEVMGDATMTALGVMSNFHRLLSGPARTRRQTAEMPLDRMARELLEGNADG